MFRPISNDGLITVFAIDTESDVQNLPTNVGQGSMAILSESSDGTGMGRVVYMLNGRGQWVK